MRTRLFALSYTGNLSSCRVEQIRKFGFERNGWIDAWEADKNTFDSTKFLSLVEDIGKGRFAQRLATRIAGLDPPEYISLAINFVAERV